jgi:hypothetical protein
MKTAIVLSLLLPLAAHAQDERRVSSPDGNVEFRIFVSNQPDTSLIRVAYQVFYRQKPVIKTSYMALDIWTQEPMLGEATGLISSRTESSPAYNTLFANYMQNGSLGRLLTVETRAYNDRIMFRYIIPKSTPLIDLSISDEATEFALPNPTAPPPTLPFITQQPGGIRLEITEIPDPNFPPMHLILGDDHVLHTRLAHQYDGATPFTCPWRVIRILWTEEHF